MKTRLLFLFLTGWLIVGMGDASAAVAPAAVEKSAATHRAVTKEDLRKQARMERRQARLEKRLQRLEARLANKMEKKAAPSVWDESRFRIGAILIGGAIVLGILAAIIGGAGFLGVIAGLAALAGLVLIIWSLIEYYG